MRTFATAERCRVPTTINQPRPPGHAPLGRAAAIRRHDIRDILRGAGAQGKLTVGRSNDKYEQEADRVADQVMRMASSASGGVNVQPVCAGGEEDLQRHAAEGGEQEFPQTESPTPRIDNEAVSGGKAPGMVHDVLNSQGRSLDPALREFMEPRFGRDFSEVRVHAGTKASASARALGARAYVVGSNVVFGAGEYAPSTKAGRRLLAHELTHVVQQSHSVHLLQRASCKNQSDVDTRIAANPRKYDTTRVSMYAHVIQSGDTISGLAGKTSKDNNVASKNNLTQELVALNKGLNTGSIGYCTILLRGWTSAAYLKKKERTDCTARIDRFKKDPAYAAYTSWETETVKKTDKGYKQVVDRVKARNPGLFQGRSGLYEKIVKQINYPIIGPMNPGECVALPVGWKDRNIGQLPKKPTDTSKGDPAHVIATVYSEQTGLSADAKEQQAYIWYSIRLRIVAATHKPDLKSVVNKGEFHAIDGTNYKAAIADLKKTAPSIAGVANAQAIVLGKWDTALPAKSGRYYFHWNDQVKTAEACYNEMPVKDRPSAAKRMAQERKCAWKHARDVVIGGHPGVSESRGYLKRISGGRAAPDERKGTMFIYP